jgi:hypothetical protein
VKASLVDPGAREAYWSATHVQLKSIQRRGDALTLLAVAAACPLLVIFRSSWAQAAPWAILWMTLATVSFSVWFVISRRRRIAAARGLVCGQCKYMPHDTEIMEVAQTRQCPRCEASLEQ